MGPSPEVPRNSGHPRRSPPWTAAPHHPALDESRRAAALRDKGGVDPERGSAPIDMGVEVNEAGHHDEAARIDDFRALEGEAGADSDDLAGAKPDIGDRVAPEPFVDVG